MVLSQLIGLPDGTKITSLTMTEEEFNCFCDDLENWVQLMCEEIPVDIDQMRQMKMLPMMPRISVTERFFDMYRVETDILSIAVEGIREKMMEEASKAIQSMMQDNANLGAMRDNTDPEPPPSR